jgi:hypothetical protein
MPAYSKAGPAQVPDMYNDSVPKDQEAPPDPEEKNEQAEDSEHETTAELPKAVLGGKDFKPGEEVMLQVVKVMEDSVLVKYSTKGEETEEAPPEEEAPPSAPQGGPMSSMMG